MKAKKKPGRQPGQKPKKFYQKNPAAGQPAAGDHPGSGQAQAGRPAAGDQPGSGSRPAAGGLDQEDIDLVTNSVGSLFDLIAIRAGDHWSLNAAESKSIGRPLARVIKKYAPNFNQSDEIVLTMAVMAAVGSRVKQSIEISQEKQQTAPGNENKP